MKELNEKTENQKPLTPEEKWNKATIANNFIFYKIMRHNPDVCKELLEILLEMEIEKIEIRTEETIEIDYGSKSIRLDVYAKNSTQAFNLEMQTTDEGDLPERARYYQGAMDVDCLNAGQKYSELKNSYVIFICIPDIFKKGMPYYSFEYLCREDNKIRLNDRTLKYFFIADNCDKIFNDEQKAFLELVIGKESRNSFTKKLEILTDEAKHNTEWKRQYMTWERQRTYDYENGKEAGIVIGEQQGAQQKAIEAAENGIKIGLTDEQIKAVTGVSDAQLAELKNKILKTK